MRYRALTVIASIAITLSSCHRTAEKTADRDAQLAEQTYDYVDETDGSLMPDTDSFGRTEDESLYALRNDAFATIQLGMPLSWLPDSEEGLYSSYSKEYDDITGDIVFTLRSQIPTDGTQRTGIDDIQVIGNGDAEVMGFTVPTKYMVYAVVNDHVYELPRITAADIFASGPCQAFHVYYMGLCVYTDNMTFFFDEDALTAAGHDKVYADVYAETTLERSDFRPSARPFTVLLGERTFI